MVRQVTVDTIPPTQPKVDAVTDTNTSRPTITGTCEPGATVTLMVDGTPVTPTVTCDSNGTYSITPDNNLSDGSKTFTVSQTDSAGNTSPTSAVTPSAQITVDTTPPIIIIDEVNIDNDGKLTVIGITEANVTVEVTFPDGITVTVISDSNGSYSATSKYLQPTGNIIAVAIDSAGNSSNIETRSYKRWYKESHDDGIEFKYGDSTISTNKLTQINIVKELDTNREEDNSQIKLSIKSSTGKPPAPEIIPNVPEDCDKSSYSAFVTLYKGDGSVAPGYWYSDPICNQKGILLDSTIYDGKKALRFKPGTKVKVEKADIKKGGTVIIIETIITKEIKFGER